MADSQPDAATTMQPQPVVYATSMATLAPRMTSLEIPVSDYPIVPTLTVTPGRSVHTGKPPPGYSE